MPAICGSRRIRRQARGPPIQRGHGAGRCPGAIRPRTRRPCPARALSSPGRAAPSAAPPPAASGGRRSRTRIRLAGGLRRHSDQGPSRPARGLHPRSQGDDGLPVLERGDRRQRQHRSESPGHAGRACRRSALSCAGTARAVQLRRHEQRRRAPYRRANAAVPQQRHRNAGARLAQGDGAVGGAARDRRRRREALRSPTA